MGPKLRSDVYEAAHSRYNGVVMLKFARFDWEIPQLDAETRAYQWIDGHGIGPGFLGHLSEEGRIIGFIMENIAGGSHATPADLALRQETLSRLHKIGIKHGDTNKHSFLIFNCKATLIDFDCSMKCDNAGVLDEEMNKLDEALSDTSGRGGRIVEGDAV